MNIFQNGDNPRTRAVIRILRGNEENIDIEFNGSAGYLEAVVNCIEIHTVKNTDYSGGGDNDHPLANFLGSQEIGIDPEDGILLRMFDKWQRIKSFKKNGSMAVKDEPFEDALKDIANYCLLLLAYRAEKAEDVG